MNTIEKAVSWVSILYVILSPIFFTYELFFNDYIFRDFIGVILGVGVCGQLYLILSAFYLHNKTYILDKIVNKTVILLAFFIWIYSLIVLFAWNYRVLGILNTERSDKLVTDPWGCIYFSLITWTTVGYGDIRPSGSARFVAAAEAFCGYVVMAVLIVLLTNIFSDGNRMHRARNSENSTNYE